MAWLAWIIAWLLEKDAVAGQPVNAQIYAFLERGVHTQYAALLVAWVIFAVVVTAIIVVAVLWLVQEFSDLNIKITGCCSGCFVVLILGLPFWQWIEWMLAKDLLNSFSRVTGVVDPLRFWGAVIVILSLGAG